MELSTRLCPLCHVPFLQIPVGDGSIEICEKCQGTFFEFDEL
ncbi:MAG: Transcription factor zinc-finger [Patescibacteria group bacterium]|nr:Transcription factor zinc-finger [Patescibacteria group bacterium]